MKMPFFIALLLVFTHKSFAQFPAPFYNKATNSYGYKDAAGKVIIKPVFFTGDTFSRISHLAVVRVHSKELDEDRNTKNYYGMIDTNGNFVLEPKYPMITKFKNGLAAIRLNHTWGYIDVLGKVVVPEIYEALGDLKEGLIWAKKNEKYGFINVKNETIAPFKYDDARDFSEGRAAVSIDTLWGFIDHSGKEIIPVVHEAQDYPDFSEGLAPVCKNGKCGFIDTMGNIKIPFRYYRCWQFEKGIAQVVNLDSIDNYPLRYGLIDKTGKEILQPKYNYDPYWTWLQYTKTGYEKIPQRREFLRSWTLEKPCTKNDSLALLKNSVKEIIVSISYNYDTTPGGPQLLNKPTDFYDTPFRVSKWKVNSDSKKVLSIVADTVTTDTFPLYYMKRSRKNNVITDFPYFQKGDRANYRLLHATDKDGNILTTEKTSYFVQMNGDGWWGVPVYNTTYLYSNGLLKEVIFDDHTSYPRFYKVIFEYR